MNNKSVMIGGTASHVGKSWMATAICRWLRRRGLRVAPFKAQNMSNNSYPCPQGGEIGRAQAAQAEACGLLPSPDMNPILLKPTSTVGSQVIVQGKVWRNLHADEYYAHHDFLWEKVEESYARLAAEYDFLVIEGAGSITELNLRDTDLVNLGLARRLNVPVLLVGDIDRGGVFASVYGTLALLDPEEAGLVRAFAINRFRGEPRLFAAGTRILEERTGKPCLGVFPFLHDVQLDQEDSVALDDWQPRPQKAPSVAIIRFPGISNLTDFRLLTWAFWIQRAPRRQFDIVILPGSKNSIADLQWMRAQGLDEWIREQHAGGARIIGVCGGYQMLGEALEDPEQVESKMTSVKGLCLLPVTTALRAEKVTTVVNARTAGGKAFPAYEIHMGESKILKKAAPAAFVNGIGEGIRSDECIGTYLHGALESPDVLEEWIGFRPDSPPGKEAAYDRLAQWFEQSADLALFEKLFL
jgi:adenosylcobyric acid synthase